jgi:hypothetical protein
MARGQRRLLVGLVSVVTIGLAATVVCRFGNQLTQARQTREDATQVAAAVAQEMAISETLSLQLRLSRPTRARRNGQGRKPQWPDRAR